MRTLRPLAGTHLLPDRRRRGRRRLRLRARQPQEQLPRPAAADVRNYERPAPYVLQPAVEAGDVLIFTEALVHGTMPWTTDHERRCLLYKYSPGHSAWDRDGYDVADYRDFYLTERRRRIIMQPFPPPPTSATISQSWTRLIHPEYGLTL